MKKTYPDSPLPKGYGLVVPLERLEFLTVAEDQTAVKLAIAGGPGFALESVDPIPKARLLSGELLTVPFLFENELEKGSGKVFARIAIRYSTEDRRFEILEGKGALTVVVPGLIGESDVVPFHNLTTVPIP
jgi:hypothetical protein